MATTITNYKLQNTNYKQSTCLKKRRVPYDNVQNFKGGHGLHKDSFRLHTITTFNKKFLQGGLNQWVSSMIARRSYESLIIMPRPHPETNENQHKRFAQHIGSPRRGAPGRRRQKST